MNEATKQYYRGRLAARLELAEAIHRARIEAAQGLPRTHVIRALLDAYKTVQLNIERKEGIHKLRPSDAPLDRETVKRLYAALRASESIPETGGVR